jgi:ketosteroid isomerase-like protein
MRNALLSGMLFPLLFGFPLPGVAQHKNQSTPLSSLVSTEREFAATSLKEGIRASFWKYFADDGISISPKPHIYKESALKTPPPAHPLARTLYWEPIVADVSSSDDLGYTMGPASLKDSAKGDAPTWYGFYFTIWKRQKDGNWKVAVDIGTGSTNVVEKYFGRPLAPALHAVFKSRGITAGGKAASRELITLDRAFSQTAIKGGGRGAYQKLLDAHACAMREGLVPITGKEAILAYLVKGTSLRSLEPMRAEASAAGDLGYTYGAYREKRNANDPSGYYVRVWRKDAKRKWALVVEVASPAS